MLVCKRKSGQGFEAMDNISGKLYDFDFLYNKDGYSTYRINGQERTVRELDPFYLDEEKRIQAIPVKVIFGLLISIGIDADRDGFEIRRKEIPFKR